jgi:hypothetical protein
MALEIFFSYNFLSNRDIKKQNRTKGYSAIAERAKAETDLIGGEAEALEWMVLYKFGLHQMRKKEFDMALVSFDESCEMEKTKTVTKYEQLNPREY